MAHPDLKDGSGLLVGHAALNLDGDRQHLLRQPAEVFRALVLCQATSETDPLAT